MWKTDSTGFGIKTAIDERDKETVYAAWCCILHELAGKFAHQQCSNKAHIKRTNNKRVGKGGGGGVCGELHAVCPLF